MRLINLALVCFFSFVFSFSWGNQIVNQILFSEGGTSWTSRDQVLYKKILSAALKQEKLTEYSENEMDDFLISRLVKREGSAFEIKPSSEWLSPNLKNLNLGDYSKKEIEDEVKSVAYAMTFLNLREKQITQKARFKAWIDVLKRKYQVKMKVN